MLQVLSTCIRDLCRVFIISRLELLKLLFSRLGSQSSNYQLFLISSKKEKEAQMQKSKTILRFTHIFQVIHLAWKT